MQIRLFLPLRLVKCDLKGSLEVRLVDYRNSIPINIAASNEQHELCIYRVDRKVLAVSYMFRENNFLQQLYNISEQCKHLSVPLCSTFRPGNEFLRGRRMGTETQTTVACSIRGLSSRRNFSLTRLGWARNRYYSDAGRSRKYCVRCRISHLKARSLSWVIFAVCGWALS